jgi:hypothetical protein
MMVNQIFLAKQRGPPAFKWRCNLLVTNAAFHGQPIGMPLGTTYKRF